MRIETDPGVPFEGRELWVVLTEDEARQLADALVEYLCEPARAPGWHTHVGNVLTVAIEPADTPPGRATTAPGPALEPALDGARPEEIAWILELAKSESWSNRAAAGVRLTQLVAPDAYEDQFIALIADPADTAVTTAVSSALIRRAGAAGMRIVLKAAARADADTILHIGDALLAVANDDHHDDTESLVRPFAEDPEPEVAAGAGKFLGDPF